MPSAHLLPLLLVPLLALSAHAAPDEAEAELAELDREGFRSHESADAAHRRLSHGFYAVDGLHWDDYNNNIFNAGSGIACTPPNSFTHIDFTRATLVRSNLGGLGGRCGTPGLCIESNSPLREIYIRDVGYDSSAGTAYQRFDMRITNETECTHAGPR